MTYARTFTYIIMVFAILFGAKYFLDRKNTSPMALLDSEQEAEVGAEILDSMDVSASKGSEISPIVAMPSVIEPKIESGDLLDVNGSTYRFSGINWSFSNAGTDSTGMPLTTVRLSLTDFVRNGSLIDLSPYRLGTYAGTCFANSSFSASLEKNQRLLGKAECVSEDKRKQFLVYQEGPEIGIMYRTASDQPDFLTQPLKPLLMINVATIVQD